MTAFQSHPEDQTAPLAVSTLGRRNGLHHDLAHDGLSLISPRRTLHGIELSA